MDETKRRRMLRESVPLLNLSKDALRNLVEFWWSGVSLSRFLPAGGARLEEAVQLPLVWDQVEQRHYAQATPTVTQKEEHLQPGEWVRAVLTMGDMYARAVDPLFSTFASRYTVFVLSYFDAGYSWKEVVAASKVTWHLLSAEFRGTGGSGGVRGGATWEYIASNSMTLQLNKMVHARGAPVDETPATPGTPAPRPRGGRR